MTFTKTKTPRETATLVIRCYAPPTLVGSSDWDDLSEDAKKWHTENKALACEGTGDVWSGCTHCQFCDFDCEISNE